MTQLIKKQRSSTSYLSFYVNFHGILAKNEYDTILNTWKMFFQASDDKGRIFQNFQTMIQNQSNHLYQKRDCGSNILAIPICCVLKLLEQQSIMYLLVNITLDYSLRKSLSVYTVYTLLNQDIISFMHINVSTTTGIQEEIQQHTSLSSQSLIVMPFPLMIGLLS